MSNTTKNKKKNTKQNMVDNDKAKQKAGKKSTVPQKLSIETIQQTVPIFSIHEKYGLIETYPGCYVRSYYIGDNNYMTAPDDEQLKMFADWRRLLNSFGNNMEFAVSINNRTMSEQDIREANMIKETGDPYDYLRKQMNRIITDRVRDGKNSIRKDKYLTVAVHEPTPAKAALVFGRLDKNIDQSINRIGGSSAKPIALEDMLDILYGLYNDPSEHFIQKSKIFDAKGDIVEVSSFDFDNMRRMGLTINDLIGPVSMEIKPNKMRMGKKWVRTLKVTSMPSQLRDDFISKVTDMSFDCLTTINYKAISTRDADTLINTNLTMIRDEKVKRIRQGQKNGVYDDSFIPAEVLDREAEALTLRDDVRENDEKLFKTTLTVSIFADNEEDLDQFSEIVVTEYKRASAQLTTMISQQEEGFNSTLPLCYNQIKAKRTLKSSSAAILLPFDILELNDPGGINYSCNLVSKNLVVANRLSYANFNSFILGSSGCVDRDTEFFNGKEWKSIADYQEGEKVLQFDTNTNEATLVVPERYIKAPCDKMYHFETAWGINQTLSPEHRVLYRTYLHRSKKYSEMKEMSAEELYQHIKERPFHGRIQTNFDYSGPGIDMTDAEIKVMLAVICDGTFDYRYPDNNYCSVRLSKQRKIEELRSILIEWGEPFKECVTNDGYTRFYFQAPRREKEFSSYWYNCNKHQLQIVCNNILKWDGCITRGKSFVTAIKSTADFIQFAFSACGYRATITLTERKGEIRVINGKKYERSSDIYTVNIAAHTMTGFDYVDDYGINKIDVQEVKPEDGYKYCFTVPTHALVLRRKGRVFITGNSGKSFTAKNEMLNVFLKSNADIVIIDPENEYGALAKLLGGEVIEIRPGGVNRINPMEVAYTDNDDTSPLQTKVDFILRLFELIIKSPFGMTSVQEGIIDEEVRKLYSPFINDDGDLEYINPDDMPTLTDLQRALAKRPEREALELAGSLKLYTGEGSLNVFGGKSTVNVNNRFVVYQIRDVNRLTSLAMLTILDHIWNQVVANRKLGKQTWFYVDEIYLLFQNEYSAEFLEQFFRRARKYGGVPTGITQNVTPLLESKTGREMLQNCEFVQILKQSGPDREALKSLFNLSDTQISYITASPKGQGLIYNGRNVIPFYSSFPKDNDCYKVMTSDQKEIAQYALEKKKAEAEKNRDKK